MFNDKFTTILLPFNLPLPSYYLSLKCNSFLFFSSYFFPLDDRAIDLWSVAVCLYELFTGHVMFPGRSNNEMLRLMMAIKGAHLSLTHFYMLFLFLDSPLFFLPLPLFLSLTLTLFFSLSLSHSLSHSVSLSPPPLTFYHSPPPFTFYHSPPPFTFYHSPPPFSSYLCLPFLLSPPPFPHISAFLSLRPHRQQAAQKSFPCL